MQFDDDLLLPDHLRDPHALFDRRRSQSPVHWNGRHSAWMVMTYAGVAEGLRHPDLSSDRVPALEAGGPGSVSSAFEVLRKWLVFQDPPDHSRLRHLVVKSFTSNAVARSKRRIEAIADELANGLGSTPFDLVAEFAYPFPAVVIAELLGVPAGDRDLFRQWSDDISALVFGSDSRTGDRERSARAMLAFVEYFSALIRRYERKPADNLLSSLIAARDDLDALTHDEVIATAILILFAGHETTSNLIAVGIYRLLQAPDQKAMLLNRPELVETAVDELLRFDGPSKIAVRHARRRLRIQGQTIDAGDKVFLVQASANRDPAVFSNAETLDITRSPNPHLGFGHGIHFCVGAPLARFETQVAIQAIFRRFPQLELAGDDIAWEPVLINRGPLALRVSS